MPHLLAVDAALETAPAPTVATQAIGFYIFCLLTACVAAWGLVGGRWRRTGQLMEYEPQAPAPWGLLDVVVAIVVWFLGQLVAINAAAAIGDFQPGQTTFAQMTASQRVISIWSMAAVEWAGVFFILAWLGWRCRFDWRRVGWRADKFGYDVGLGLLAFVMIVPPVLAIQTAATRVMPDEKHPFIEILMESPDPQLMGAIFFSAVLTAPVFEELLFRATIQGWLERLAATRWRNLAREDGDAIKWIEARSPEAAPSGASQEPEAASGLSASEKPASPSEDEAAGDRARASLTADRRSPWAIVITSLLFAGVHVGQGPAPIALFFALALGFLYQQTHRLTPCIVLHLALNAQTTVLLLLQTQAPDNVVA